MRKDFLSYGAAIVFFGGVVLWATDASLRAVAFAAIAAAILLLAAALLVRPAPAVLLVGERPDEHLDSLHRAIGEAGFRIETCPGPASGSCPAEHGRPCPAHEHPVAAIVMRHPDETAPLPPCGRALGIVEMAVEEDSDRAAEFEGSYARIGLGRGTTAVVETLDRLVTRT